MTPVKGYIFPQLDGLRGIAALIVLFHHFWPSIRFDPTGGRLGVDIFFVLSGFLITRTLLRAQKETPDAQWSLVKRFQLRRARRIIPVYYLTLVLACLIPKERSIALVWHATFLSNVYFVLQGHFVGSGAHLWALAVEEHFYLFWPFVVLFIPRRYLGAAAGVMIAGGLLFRALARIGGWSDLAIDVLTPGAFEALGLGALLASWMEGREQSPQRVGRWASIVGLTGLALCLLRVGAAPTAWTSRLFTELSRSLLLTWLIAQAVWGIPGWVGSLLESDAARALGHWSYAMYLSHNFIFAMWKARPHHLGTLSVHDSQALLATATTLLWSAVCYHYLEKPLLQKSR